ncbi:MAG: winged helix-turn-helix transcriptional regulator [Desulfohalobiaceae bacterium]
MFCLTQPTKSIKPLPEPQNQSATYLRITYNELARATGLNRKTIQRHIRSLKDKGLLRRTGGARGGHWEVDAS